MKRQATAPCPSGDCGRDGPLTQRMAATGAALSSVKSVAPAPSGMCSGRSRLVQTVWIDSWRRSLRYGASCGSTREMNTSPPM